MKYAQVQAVQRKIPSLQVEITSKVFHDQVEDAYIRFWSRNQISGFDKDGQPIRTDKPRIRMTSGKANDIGQY